MKAALFFFKSALTHLRRGGQRNLVAFLCVAFGVMSLVAMTTLAKSIEKMLVLKPYELIGGDLTLDREGEDFISIAEEQELKDLLTQGKISDYTLIDYSTALSFHTLDSGELFFPSVGMGVDPDKYPLAGNLTFSSPAGAALPELLQKTGDLVISVDLALAHRLKVGDQIVLANLDYGQPLTATIRGIASDTPNHQGSKIYYSHETAFALTGSPRTANTVLVNTGNAVGTAAILENSGWRVFTAEQLAQATAVSEGALAMGLNDFGLLGMLVSGIGIANTMQVLLRRRRKEVAVWKTLGYKVNQIQSMFVTEAAILGLCGSLVGAGLGLLLSLGMVGLFSRTTTVLIRWVFSPEELVGGVVIGILTTVIFAAWAIVSTSRVRPLALLRHEELEAAQIPPVQSLLLALGLAIPYLAIAVWVLKSFLTGLLVLIGSIVILAVVGLILWLLMKLAVKLLPSKHWPVGQIAKKSLVRRSSTQVFAMVALFSGVLMLAAGSVITGSGQKAIGEMTSRVDSENLAIFAAPQADAAVRAELASHDLNAYAYGHLYRVQQITAAGVIDHPLTPVLMARSDPGSAVLHGAEWGSAPQGAYAYPYSQIPIGTKLQITDVGGVSHEIEVVGTYENGDQPSWPGLNDKLLISEELGNQLGEAANSQFFLTLESDQLTAMVEKLGKALPQTTLINMPDFQNRFIRQYQNLYAFVVAMAALAILAGVLLVANSVSLAMLDRRFEIGVLKSIGYSQTQVLISQVVEYTLMAVVVSLAALLLVWGLLGLAGLVSDLLGSLLLLSPSAAAWIAFATIAATGLAVTWAAWKPSHVSPVFVLNDRE